jgi:hypothetical protein
VGWILVEVAIIWEFSVLQPIHAAAGVGLIATSRSILLRGIDQHLNVPVAAGASTAFARL